MPPGACAAGLTCIAGQASPAPPSTSRMSSRAAMTQAENEQQLLDDALDILARLARQAGMPVTRDAWRDRLLWLASYLRTEDAMHAELNVPASERRRDLRRIADRLERLARGERRWKSRITMSDAVAIDVQKVWPDFEKELVEKVTSPDEAGHLAVRLRRVDEALDRSVYGRAAGHTRPDLPLMWAAAGLADLIQDACGGVLGQPPPISPKSAWALLLQRVSELAGRPTQGGAADVSHVLELVRADLQGVERPTRAVRPRRGKQA